MDEEDSQDELINHNASHGKGKRAATWSISDDDSDDGGEGEESEGQEEGDSDSVEDEEEEGDHIDGEEDEEDEEDEEEDTDDGEEDEEEDAGKAVGGAVGGASADLADLSSDEDSEKCPICLNSFHSQPVATPESCEHYFCLDCLLEWSKNANSCPVDRIVFNNIYLRKCYGGRVQKMITVQKPVKASQEEPVDLTLEQTTCEVCRGSDREDRLLLCDGCDAGYHMECLTPPLDAVPVEEWFCPECEANNRHRRSSADDLSDAESLHSDRPTTSRPRPAAAGPTRAIARTQQSERVRANVNRHRITQARTAEFAPRFLMQSTWLDDTINAVVAGLNTAVYIRDLTPRPATRRKTVRRRKGVSKKPSSASGGKGKAAGSGVKRRRRKVRRKKSRRKTAVKKAPTSRGRIARSLGIGKPKRGSSLPSVYRPTETTLGSMRSDIGAASLSVYGDPYGLDSFDNGDEEEEQAQVTSLLDAKRRGLSRSALRSHQPVARPITAGVSRRGGPGLPPVEEVVEAAPVPDLLGSILSGQSMLLMDSADVVINRDGTLKALKPVSMSSSSRPGSSRTSSPGDPGPQITPGMSPNPGVSPLSLHSNDPAGPSFSPQNRPSPGPCLSPLTPSSPGPTSQSHQQPPYSHPPALGHPSLHPHAPHRPNNLHGHSHRGTNGVGAPHGSHREATSTSVPTPDYRSRGREAAQSQVKKAAPKPVWAGDVSELPRIPKLKRESSVSLTNGSTSRGGSSGSGSSSSGGSGNASGSSNANGSSKASASGSRNASGSSKANASGSSNASARGSCNASGSSKANASGSSNANAARSGNTNANGGSNGLPGAGMHSLAGNRGKQQGVDQQQGRTQRPRADRAAPSSSAFSNSFSSSSASPSANPLRSSSSASSSSSFSTVCFRINSSGNAWLARPLNNALETVAEATAQEAAEAAARTEKEKMAKKRVAHVSKHAPVNSHTQVKEEAVEEEIYDPFNPTGSDSNGSDSEAEGQAADRNSQNATVAVGGKRPGHQVKAETLESRISLAGGEGSGGKRVEVKKEPEHTVGGGSERPGHGPRPAPKPGTMIAAGTPLPHSLVPVKIERKDPGEEEEEENGTPSSLQKRASAPAPTPSTSAPASSHHSERKVKTEVKLEPNDSPPSRTTKSRSKSPSRSSGQGRKASKGNGGVGGGNSSKERRSVSSSPEAGRRRGGLDQAPSSSSQGRKGRGEDEGRERRSKRSRSRERKRTRSPSDSSLSESSDRRRRRSRSCSKDRRRSRSRSGSSSRERLKRRRRGDERRGGSRERNDSARGNERERERERGRVLKDKRHGGRSRSRSRSRDRRKEKEDHSRSQQPASSSSGSKVRVESGSKDRKRPRSRSRSRERRKEEGSAQKTTQKTTPSSSKEPKELSSKEPKELSSKELKDLKEKALPQGSLKEKRDVRPIKQEIPAFVSGLKPVKTVSDIKKEINCVDIGTDSDASAKLVKEESKLVMKVIKKEKLPSFDIFEESVDTKPIKKEKTLTPSLSVVKDLLEPKEIKKEKLQPPLKNEAFLLSLEARGRKEQVPSEKPVKIKSEPIWPELPQHLPSNVLPPPSTAPPQPSPGIPSPSPGPLPQATVTADSPQRATSSLPPPASNSQTETATQTSVQFQRMDPVKEEVEEQPLDSDEDFNDVDIMLDSLDFVKNEKSEEGDPGGGGGEEGDEVEGGDAGVTQKEVEGEGEEVEVEVKTEGEPELVPVTVGAGAKTKPSVKRVTWNLEEPEEPPVEKTASKLALYKLKLKQEGARRPASSTQLSNQVAGAASSGPLPPAGLSNPGQVEDSEEGGTDPLRNNTFMKKLHMQERAIEEVKLAIKPFYQKRFITKDEYKEIVRKAVQKVCHSKSGEINPVKVANLVKAYVDKYKHARKHRREEDGGRSQEETETEGTRDPETP